MTSSYVGVTAAATRPSLSFMAVLSSPPPPPCQPNFTLGDSVLLRREAACPPFVCFSSPRHCHCQSLATSTCLPFTSPAFPPFLLCLHFQPDLACFSTYPQFGLPCFSSPLLLLLSFSRGGGFPLASFSRVPSAGSSNVRMPARAAKRDSVSLSQHFKLCGFLKLVVSVSTNAEIASCSFGTSDTPCQESLQQRDRKQKRPTGHSTANSRCSDPERSTKHKARRLDNNWRGNPPCKQRDFHSEDAYSPSGDGNDSDGLSSSNVNMLTGAECWLAEEAGEVLLRTSTGLVLRSVKNGRHQQASRDLGTTNPDVSTEVGEVSSGLPGFGGLEEGSDAHHTCSVSGKRPLYGSKTELKRKSVAYITSQSDKLNIAGQVRPHPKKRTRRKARRNPGSRDVLHQLQLLTSTNNIKIKGHVVVVACRGADVRAVVLLDLYLSYCVWSSDDYWNAGPVAAAVLNHISCDWDTRKQYLAGTTCQGVKFENVEAEELWNLGECGVLGCKIHFQLSREAKRSRFNLHALFKSVPSLNKEEYGYKFVIVPNQVFEPRHSGIWDVPDEILSSIFSRLFPRDLQSIAAVCRHTRELAVSVVPCMTLKLFPHQLAAVQWMLQRELNPQSAVHPLYRDLQAEDGFHIYANCISGALSSEPPPTVMDFRGGLFCDEPGLGKTVTALSLILKTQGTLSAPPAETQVRWCYHGSGDKYGYYEVSSSPEASVLKTPMDLKARQNRSDLSSPEYELVPNLITFPRVHKKPKYAPPGSSSASTQSRQVFSGYALRGSLKRKICEGHNEPDSGQSGDLCSKKQRKSALKNSIHMNDQDAKSRRPRTGVAVSSKFYEDYCVWIQCDSCSKWRKLPDGDRPPDVGVAWFCNMNKDPLHQSCSDPEENWEDSGAIRSLPGFYKVGSCPGQEQNIAHFAAILNEYSCRRRGTDEALHWLTNLHTEKLEEMAGPGLTGPFGDSIVYQDIFLRFGLVFRKRGRGAARRWCYPRHLDNLVFDLPALRVALTRPANMVRMYLSRATLIVVPLNLVEHWKNQIFRHTKSGQLRVFVWSKHRKSLPAQELAWNYDVVITTFPRLSAEWLLRERSVLMKVHWLRIIVDEGHTLGSSLYVTNKLQMAMSMHASRRWLLTGTPIPNTPKSQVAHMQPMLKFLHEEIYGEHCKSWEGAILKPFKAGCEEGRIRLLQLLQRCMTSARKSNLPSIPRVRKVTLLDFTPRHAESYNERVLTVRRNILMADWNDPSHTKSLLNPKQWKFRSTTIRNVRLSCCVAGHIKVRNVGEDIKKTMDIFIQQGMDPMSQEFAIIQTALLYGGNCKRCEEWCRLPIVTPCKHLLCLDCVSLDRERCSFPACGHHYKMQSPEDLARSENPNPKWPVPQDLIELQPSYVQVDWDPDWKATSSSKVTYLAERLKTLQCHHPDEDNAQGQKQIQQRSPPKKVIVFSQFQEHINAIKIQLTQAGINVATLYNALQPSKKKMSLSLFQNDMDCTVLLMDGTAALGLDFSFVSHVFLMEPIWDHSLEEQVISRAHRMGATRPVLVEILAMRGTIEEQMLQFLQDPAKHSQVLKGRLLEDGCSSYQTVHEFAESSYLARLSFVRTKSGC